MVGVAGPVAFHGDLGREETQLVRVPPQAQEILLRPVLPERNGRDGLALIWSGLLFGGDQLEALQAGKTGKTADQYGFLGMNPTTPPWESSLLLPTS